LITGYVVRTKEKSIQETKHYYIKRLEQLALSHIGDIPQLHEPTYEQEQWIKFRLLHGNTWPKVHENKIGDRKNWQ
jgi:hypothetical protein